MDSILNTIKQKLNVDAANTVFDVDIVTEINTAIMVLNQLGVGKTNFQVTDATQTWVDFVELPKYAGVQTYIYLRARLVFDPPSTSFVIESINNQIAELGWRLRTIAESTV